jgi:hypothetical protein
MGQGTLYWAAYPVELSEGSKAGASLYYEILDSTGFKLHSHLDSPYLGGLLLFPIELQDSVLYIMESESDSNTDVDFRDEITGVQLKFVLRAQRAAIAIIDKHTRRIVAKYGF